MYEYSYYVGKKRTINSLIAILSVQASFCHEINDDFWVTKLFGNYDYKILDWYKLKSERQSFFSPCDRGLIRQPKDRAHFQFINSMSFASRTHVQSREAALAESGGQSVTSLAGLWSGRCSHGPISQHQCAWELPCPPRESA